MTLTVTGAVNPAGTLPLMDWLQPPIWPAEARLDADDVYWGTRLACLEMIRTGTVRFWDMYWQRGGGGRAGPPARPRGPRGPAPPRAAPPVPPCLAPHGIYTVSAASLAWVAETAAARDLFVHLHFLEIE